MSTRRAYTALVLAVGVERLAELVVSRRNVARSLAAGGREVGSEHYPVMVALHTGLLGASLAEVQLCHRRARPAGVVALGAVVAAQGLRWWCIRTLGPQWSTRVVVVPGAARGTGGPYRWLRHPNYVAVVVEVAALPLVHDARWTALVFSAANSALLRRRIRVENAALELLAS